MSIIIDCPYCESKVDAKVLADISGGVNEDVGVPVSISFLQCPSCKEALVSYQELENISGGPDDWDYGTATRVWPKPEKAIHYAVPELVRASIEEAEKCYQAKAYYACAVMCGRAIEGITADHKVNSKSFAGGLKELLEKEVIDKKLFAWSEALRKHRNVGAHASIEKITKEDARDLIDFANAISDYIYVLTYKFQNFMSRTQPASTNEENDS